MAQKPTDPAVTASSTSSASPASPPGATDEARSAGRGALFIAAAKVLFILTGWTIQIALPRIFPTDEEFGLYSVALGATSMLNNVLVVSTIQTVSKLVSEDEARSPAIIRQGLRLQAVVGSVLSGLGWSIAPWLAESVLLDPALTPLLRAAAAVIFAYSIYAALVGSLNGRRLFHRQAALDVTFSILRTAGILGGAVLMGSAFGSMVGWAMAALSILVIALVTVGVGGRGEGFPLRHWLAFMAPIWVYQAFLNGMMQIDLQVLKVTLAELALDGGAAAAAAAAVANRAAAHYRAAQVFAFVPYQLILAVTFIVFPLVSRATSLGDEATTRRYIENAMRFSAIVLLAIAAPVAGVGDGVIGLVYPASFAPGGAALTVLAFGLTAFALFVIGATILSGARRPGIAAVIAGVSLVAILVVTRGLLHAPNTGLSPLVLAAIGTTVGTVLALVAVGVVLRTVFRAFLPWATAARVAAAAAVAFAVGRALPHPHPLATLGSLTVAGLAYLAVLALTRELRGSDLALVMRVLGRGR